MAFYRASGHKDYSASYTVTVDTNQYKLPTSVESFYNLNNRFNDTTLNMYNFNEPITIGDNVINCQNLLGYCTCFNSNVRFGKNVKDAGGFFYSFL